MYAWLCRYALCSRTSVMVNDVIHDIHVCVCCSWAHTSLAFDKGQMTDWTMFIITWCMNYIIGNVSVNKLPNELNFYQNQLSRLCVASHKPLTKGHQTAVTKYYHKHPTSGAACGGACIVAMCAWACGSRMTLRQSKRTPWQRIGESTGNHTHQSGSRTLCRFHW